MNKDNLITTIFYLSIGFILVIMSVWISLSGTVVNAAPQATLPPRTTATSTPTNTPTITPTPTNTLPPRTTATATKGPTSPIPTAAPVDELLNGYLELQVYPPEGGLWAVVQWQDALKNWHDVEGWRSYLNNGYQLWWVAPKDFNTGPFRWLVYQTEDGVLLETSSVFFLPGPDNPIVSISVQIE